MKQDEWTPDQWADYYDKLSKKNYMAYQETGEQRYDNAYYRYEKIADAFRARSKQETDDGEEIRKRMTNKDYVVARLIPGKMYSYAEVVKLLDDAVWW